VGESDTAAGALHATLWTVQTTPPTPVEEVEVIIGQVEEIVNGGSLNDGVGEALVAKLNAAKKGLSGDNITAGCNVLQAFINQVNAKIKSGKLSEEEGQSLIDAATSVSACNSKMGGRKVGVTCIHRTTIVFLVLAGLSESCRVWEEAQRLLRL
jgi:hypothetical protein